MKAFTREELERREHEFLAEEAALSDCSQGRMTPEKPDALRTCYQCDRDRILHSKSFRRLAHKTQVFLAPEGDHYRTRLIHTLEVSQIARSIARPLGLNEDLTEAIALGHDLGHTPFGHIGEKALSHAISLYRGMDPEASENERIFAHNQQSARIVEYLEKDGQGLNLSHEVIDGIRCHSGNLRAETAEGRIVAISDRIAYVTHDIDDAKRAGLLSEEYLPTEAREVLGNSSPERIENMVHDIVSESSRVGDIKMTDSMWGAMMTMRAFLFANLYASGDAKYEEPKAYDLIIELFDYFVNHLDEVPAEYKCHDFDHPEIQVADYVSGMTDRYATRVFEDLRLPRSWGKRRYVK